MSPLAKFFSTKALLLTVAIMMQLAWSGVASAQEKSSVQPSKRVSNAAPREKSGRERTASPRRAKRALYARAGESRRAAPRSLVRRQAARPSLGQVLGLDEDDPLDLKSRVALVVDQDTNEVLFSKNSEAVLPIASLTKLMTALVVVEAGLSLDEMLTIDREDVRLRMGIRSNLRLGTELSRGEMLHLALMSSENRAANALGRHYPGGMEVFVEAMNLKAQELGMTDTRFIEPTGLSSENRSSARDLATLANAAYQHQLIRDLSISPEYRVAIGKRRLRYHTTNRLVLNPDWDIGLQKTGYIAEAGRCLILQAKLAGRQLIMVFLDSAGKYSRLGDAERIRRWLIETGQTVSLDAAPAS